MRAVKNNKEYSIDESQKNAYQNAGFDIFDDDGKLAAFGQGKTVPYEQYAAVTAKAKELQEENDRLEAEMDKVLEEAAEKKESQKK